MSIKNNSPIRRSIVSNTVSKNPQIKTSVIVQRGAYILYLVFNTACMILCAYQTFLWIKSHAWVKIPATRLFPDHFTNGQHWEGINKIIFWILNVDLMYILGIIAIIFYAIDLYLQFISREEETL
jgi:hypothetical protein